MEGCKGKGGCSLSQGRLTEDSLCALSKESLTSCALERGPSYASQGPGQRVGAVLSFLALGRCASVSAVVVRALKAVQAVEDSGVEVCVFSGGLLRLVSVPVCVLP